MALGNGMEPTLPAGRWLTVFAATNLYFHLSTAYDILRARGVPLGKVDLFPGVCEGRPPQISTNRPIAAEAPMTAFDPSRTHRWWAGLRVG